MTIWGHVQFQLYDFPNAAGIWDAACTESKPLPNFNLIEPFGPLDRGIHSQVMRFNGMSFG